MANQALAADPDTTDGSVASPTADSFTFTGFRNLEIPAPGVALPFCTEFDQSLTGLRDLGLSGVLIQFGPLSQIDPHTHPRAAEMFYVLSGLVEVGFVDTDNELFETTLQKGDVFVFPQGLVHWQRNCCQEPASGFSVLSSGSSAALSLAKALFTGGGTGLPNTVLATAFGTNEWEVRRLKQSVTTWNF